MKSVQVIGITGKKFSGKDTAGNFIVEKYGFERLAYADPLKSAVREIFDFNNEQLYGNDKESIDDYWNVSARQVLQFVGTDLFRNHICELLPQMGKDIWVNVLKRKIMNRLEKNPNTKFVVTDVRFFNELQAISDLKGITIKVNRDSSNQNKDSHESETCIDGFKVDHTIDNNGTKEEFFEKIDSIIKSYPIQGPG
jgi:hypothetical protein